MESNIIMLPGLFKETEKGIVMQYIEEALCELDMLYDMGDIDSTEELSAELLAVVCKYIREASEKTLESRLISISEMALCVAKHSVHLQNRRARLEAYKFMNELYGIFLEDYSKTTQSHK